MREGVAATSFVSHFQNKGVHDMKHRIAVLALAALTGLLAGSAAMADELPYRITDTLVGSMLPQEIIRAAVPFDARYEEMSADQKATLAADYEGLPAGDEPPFPQYGLRHMLKPVVRFADTYSPVGRLVASVEVDSQGRATEVKIYKSPDPQLTRVIAAALQFEPYKPGVCHGQPCRMSYVLRLDFPERGAQPVRTAGFTDSAQDRDNLLHH
jgi:hypothetical protein